MPCGFLFSLAIENPECYTEFIMKLLTPKSDVVFKKLLAEHPDILTDLINAVLKLPAVRRIRSVKVKNPIILPEDITRNF